MFDKKEDKKKKEQEAKDLKVHDEESKKTAEDKAVEAKEARNQEPGFIANAKNQIEKSFGDDQNHRYDPKDLEKAEGKASEKGLPPAQAASVKEGHDVQLNVQQDLNKAQVDKDYSDEIKVGDLVYLKPKQQFSNAAPSPIDGRPWSVMALKDGRASLVIQDPSTNLQRSEVYDLKELMLDQAK